MKLLKKNKEIILVIFIDTLVSYLFDLNSIVMNFRNSDSKVTEKKIEVIVNIEMKKRKDY